MKFKQYLILLVLSYILLASLGCNESKAPGENNPIQNQDDFVNTQFKQNLEDVAFNIEIGAFGDIHSLVIYRRNELVLEEYFRGYGPSRMHEIYSATKSVGSALIGIAIEQGLLPSVICWNPAVDDLHVAETSFAQHPCQLC